MFGLLVNAGVQWRVSQRFRLGLAVQSPTYAVYSAVSQPLVRAGVITLPSALAFGFAAVDAEASSFGSAVRF